MNFVSAKFSFLRIFWLTLWSPCLENFFQGEPLYSFKNSIVLLHGSYHSKRPLKFSSSFFETNFIQSGQTQTFLLRSMSVFWNPALVHFGRLESPFKPKETKPNQFNDCNQMWNNSQFASTTMVENVTLWHSREWKRFSLNLSL